MDRQSTSTNVYGFLAARFADAPDDIGIETESGRAYMYADLERETARYARFFDILGVRPGARIAVQVDKSADALFVYLAALRAGLIYLPLNTAYQRSEVDYFLRDAEPSFVVCAPRSKPLMDELARTSTPRHIYTLDDEGGGTLIEASRDTPADFPALETSDHDLAAILYTSGTTGRSKGAMLTHKNLISNAETLRTSWGFQSSDVLLHALPLFHVHGLFVAANVALASRARILLLRKFDAQQVIKYLPRATVFMGVPTYYVRLLAQPELSRDTCRGLRLFTSGSAPLLKDTFESFRERTGHTILERYGMSETGMNTSNPLDGERVAGTVGPPLPGISVRVVDDRDAALPPNMPGHVQVKGPNVFSGYWRMPEKTREEFTADGYFRTGDIGMFDAAGYLTIVGRSKDLVISGGYNVYPKEIEALIDDMPEVVESAVVGVPDADFGEAVTAIVVRKPGAALTDAEILLRLKRELANYKVPKRVYFADDLPRNAMGKVQKNLLRDQFSPK
jgi:malonyl-CoA/methylmalonyl-CoA synthetase